MQVLVLNPVSRVTKNVVRDVLYGCWCNGKRIGGGTVPPFGLLEIATILRNDGTETIFLDAQAEQKTFEQIVHLTSNIDVVAISTSTMTFTEDAGMLQELKEANPKLKTVTFGSHPTFMTQYTLAHPGVDIAVRHEPEFIVRDLIRAMRSGSDWQHTPGIAYKDHGQIKINP
jgi:anaerobic magnesium-protoporphyrin IX monomethyl ester cyclase